MAYVAVGSNLGDRAAFLAMAEAELRHTAGVVALRASTIDETAPLGGAAQPPYLNQMLRLAVTLTACDLLVRCHAIERQAGRVRAERWASRTLDLDLVRYDTMLCDQPALTLPHPGLRDRLFWAYELAELESDD
jgi:2-amino-4-hydroxy-6-hydroxymethyldihydropteridine diphosphokinase